MIKVTDRKLAWNYFALKLGVPWSDDFRGGLYIPTQYLGLVTKPEHVAVAVGYVGFVKKACFMHQVIEQPQFVSRKIVRETFEFPFEVCGLDAVFGFVVGDNIKAINFNKKLGFEIINTTPQSDGPDLLLMRMLKSQCRWLKGNHHGQ